MTYSLPKVLFHFFYDNRFSLLTANRNVVTFLFSLFILAKPQTGSVNHESELRNFSIERRIVKTSLALSVNKQSVLIKGFELLGQADCRLAE